MNDNELALFSRYIAELSGIRLGTERLRLLERRLADLAAAAACDSFTELHDVARSDQGIERQIVEAISINDTSFFRDPAVFELLKQKLLPDMLGRDQSRPVQILSAGCSTGQETYSIAMSIFESVPEVARCRISVLGIDQSSAAVAAANHAEFTLAELENGLDKKRVLKFFTPPTSARYRVRDDVRGLCRFEVDNLLAPRTAGPFHIILCRNVLMYFASQDRIKVITALVRMLAPEGALVVGASESLLSVSQELYRLEHNGVAYYVAR